MNIALNELNQAYQLVEDFLDGEVPDLSLPPEAEAWATTGRVVDHRGAALLILSSRGREVPTLITGSQPRDLRPRR